ncbi:Protein N-terminal asparagine amidohydrolase [Bienertia sinuspersici]
MIFVSGVPFQSNPTSEGSCDLSALMENPAVVSAALSFKVIPEKKFSTPDASSDEKGKHVYVFQREYATVDPTLVDFIGTDEATTCVGVVIRNRDNGMTSVAHMDSPKIVDLGLSQMLSKLVDSKHDSEMDVETRTGTVIPATYDHTTRCPDEVVRRIRVSASFTDSRWRNKLLETYDTQTDRFIIAPCSWSMGMVHMAYVLHQLPESEILRTCSTSPFAEAPDFVHNQRRQWNYLIEHPNWKETFRMGEPRIFTRSASGEWIMVEQAQGAAR